MSKWFEDVKLKTDYNYVSSRVRLVRNLDSFVFPDKLSQADSQVLLDGMLTQLSDINEYYEKELNVVHLNTMSDIEKQTLKERRVINSSIAAKKTATGLIYSDEEELSLVLNGEDHIRLQLLSAGMNIDKLWNTADKLDDYINEKFNYAFSEKLGYLTSYPTNVGTGIRANVVMHLPMLSVGKNFTTLINGLSRFGVSIKSVYGDNGESYGALYDISNPKTLGHSEKEIIDQVRRVAVQLNAQEDYIRSMALKDHNISIGDEVYKSYGILKYARKLTLKEALNYLSAVMRGIADVLIKLENDRNVYELMFGIQTSNLLQEAKKPLSKEELDIKRADYVRENLGNILY